MGIGFVLILLGFVGVIGAGIGSMILPRIASFVTQGSVQNSRGLIWALRLFPVACLVWAGSVFICYAVVNETAFHRDAGIGDTWTCPLPNGYAIEMIDVTDRGRVQRTGGTWESALDDVCLLQLAGRYILGGTACESGMAAGAEGRGTAQSYFLLDTTTGIRANFATYDALGAAAAHASVLPVHLEPLDVVYGRYRFTWFDALAAAGLFGVPLLCAWMLFGRVLRSRKSVTMEA